eukprot:scaffold2002_cov116-Skeletonema_dohrnii-CCMP3373.AAC.2
MGGDQDVCPVMSNDTTARREADWNPKGMKARASGLPVSSGWATFIYCNRGIGKRHLTKETSTSFNVTLLHIQLRLRVEELH